MCLYALFVFEECVQTCEVLIAEERDWGTRCVCVCHVWTSGAGGGQKLGRRLVLFIFLSFCKILSFLPRILPVYFMLIMDTWMVGWAGRSLPWAISKIRLWFKKIKERKISTTNWGHLLFNMSDSSKIIFLVNIYLKYLSSFNCLKPSGSSYFWIAVFSRWLRTHPFKQQYFFNLKNFIFKMYFLKTIF